MKEKCDNHCETCPMQSQIFCTLTFVKANNASIGALAERIENLENGLNKEETPVLLNPFADTRTSEKLPAQEVGV